ncbi:MAG: hypothetical protein M3132_06465 [Actinomycetia bacterium]|nr:hypothetical protein [Actinomycetes bacterium]
MDDLIADIQEKTWLSTEKVLEVLTLVTDFMKERLPEDLVDTVASYLGSATDFASEAAGSATGVASGAATTASAAASGAVDKAVETASTVFTMAVETVTKAVNTDETE